MRDVFYALCRVNYYEVQETIPLPEDGEELTDEQKERFDEQNVEIEKTNELYAKLKGYMKLVTPVTESSIEDPESELVTSLREEDLVEKCLVRI